MIILNVLKEYQKMGDFEIQKQYLSLKINILKHDAGSNRYFN